MQTFRVEKRRSLLTWAVLFLALGACITLMGLSALRQLNPAGLIAIAMGLYVLYWAWAYALWAPYEIRVAADGVLTFRRPLGRTRVAMRDIRTIEGVMERDFDGDPEWYMDVRRGRRRIRVASFDDAPAFLALVQSYNPTVSITGLWPMPAPPHPLPRTETEHMT